MEKRFKQIATALRMLSVDMVIKAKSGHQGMPLGMADIATVLFCNHLNFNVKNPYWLNRDRFVLSNGHGSALLYSLLYMSGYKDIKLEDLKNFRQLGYKTAGHPEYGNFDGVETTTGPLGQGIGNSVGMAMAAKLLNQKLGKKVFDYKVYCFCGDGDLMEGISYEAQNFASANELSNLILIYDDNGVTIDGQVGLSSCENIEARFKASGWNVIKTDGHNFKEIDNAFVKARREAKMPTIIIAKTIIGKYSEFAGMAKAHGNSVDEKGREVLARNLKWKHKPFVIPAQIKKDFENYTSRGSRKMDVVDDRIVCELEAFVNQEYDYKLIDDRIDIFVKSVLENKKPVATRKAFGKFLESIKIDIDNITIGSADLTESNSFVPYDGYIHYGVREHFMAACSNGLSLCGFKSFCGTFLVFSDYMRPAIRLSAMMKLDVNYVFTHDSIGTGQDGPTHQPIEQLSSLRLIPDLTVFRPCDAIEAAQCLKYSLNLEGP
ncbi:MAG: transketolase, partial [Rickettsiales bacterium]|nr:transketolase [Rickettsiales bacterium]